MERAADLCSPLFVITLKGRNLRLQSEGRKEENQEMWRPLACYYPHFNEKAVTGITIIMPVDELDDLLLLGLELCSCQELAQCYLTADVSVAEIHLEGLWEPRWRGSASCSDLSQTCPVGNLEGLR